ncbi:hypothetical protein YC2023_091854 [Brassica napus]
MERTNVKRDHKEIMNLSVTKELCCRLKMPQEYIAISQLNKFQKMTQILISKIIFRMKLMSVCLAKQQSDLDKTFEAQSSKHPWSIQDSLSSENVHLICSRDTKTKRTSTNKQIDSSEHKSNNINYLLMHLRLASLEKEELSRLIKEAEERKHSRNRRIWYTNGKVTKQRDLETKEKKAREEVEVKPKFHGDK